jgi:hypothetical protein
MSPRKPTWQDIREQMLAEYPQWRPLSAEEQAERVAESKAGEEIWERSFRGACWGFLNGRKDNLVALLRAEHPLSSEDYEWLADVLHHAEIVPPLRKKKRGRGRPRDKGLHDLATGAEYWFRLWKFRNQERHIDDAKLRGRMREEVARWEIGRMGWQCGVSIDRLDAVLALMTDPDFQAEHPAFREDAAD